MALLTSRANFKIVVTEGNGFNADPVEIEIVTQEFLKPKVVIADYQFSNEQGGQIKSGVPINLKVVVQNIGQGEAKNTEVKFSVPSNVFASDKQEFSLGNLGVGDKKELIFEFFANKQYSGNSISINAVLSESYGQYAENKTMSVELNQVLAQTKKVIVEGELSSAKTYELATLTSDVDKNIPENNITHSNRYALIIGNEDYSSNQTGISSEVNVQFAINDANIFAEYCAKTLGIPKKNITTLTNATGSKMWQNLELLSQLAKANNGNAELIFYYAGHGLPDEQTKEPYLIPVDISGNDLKYAVKLMDVYKKLTENPSQRVTVFLDACFSGGARNESLLALRAVKIKPKTDIFGSNLVVFTSSSGDESSAPYKEKQHGMFTYFLLKKLQETQGNCTYQEMEEYLKKEVSVNSLVVNKKQQTPQLIGSQDVDGKWGSWEMK